MRRPDRELLLRAVRWARLPGHGHTVAQACKKFGLTLYAYRKATRELGDEPNVLVAKSYLAGQWPPGARDPRRAALVLAATMRAHGLMAVALRQFDRVDADGDGHATRIGIAQNLRLFDPYSGYIEFIIEPTCSGITK